MLGGLLLAVAGIPSGCALEEAADGATSLGALRIQPVGDMSVDRAAHVAIPLGSGEVLVAGGCTAPGCEQVTPSAELFDPRERAFRPTGAMSTRRVSHAAATLPDGTVLVTGGWTGDRVTAGAEIYDPESETFRATADMNVARMSHAALSLGDGRILIVGGSSNEQRALASAEIYDPELDGFTPASSMSEPRVSHAAVLMEDGRALVVGGQRARGELLGSAEVFDPATAEFRPAGTMAVARHKHALAALAGGGAMAIGGSDASDFRGRFRSTETFDPEANVFRPGPALASERFKIRHAVVTLPDGRVVVGGGASSVEVYDPASGTFGVEGELGSSLMFSTATLLGGSSVLLAGGYDEGLRPTRKAWILSR